MKKSWKKVKLKNIFTKVNGLWTGKKEPFVEVKVYTMTNFTKDSFLNKDKEPREIVASLSQFEKRKLQKGDILVEKSGGGPNQPVGRAVLFDIENGENNTFSNFTTRLRINENFTDKVYPNFVHHFLRLKYIDGETEKFQKNSTNIRNLQLDEYLEQSFSFPPLPEQQRIVSILDSAFAAIDKAKANAEQNLKNAKELFESYLQGVFENGSENWKNKTLGELCTFTQGIQRGVKLQSETQANGQVRFLRIVDYTQGNEPPRYIDHPGDKYILNEEDVALVRYGASTGFVCHGMEGALANNLFRVIPKSFEELSNRFLAVYLKSPIFQDVIKSTMNGAAMPAISFGLIKEIPFPLPNLEEQQTIIQKLTAVQAETQKLEAVYQKKMDDLEELKKSILQKAFAGELKEKEVIV